MGTGKMLQIKDTDKRLKEIWKRYAVSVTRDRPSNDQEDIGFLLDYTRALEGDINNLIGCLARYLSRDDSQSNGNVPG